MSRRRADSTGQKGTGMATTATEQLLIELINRARLDPVGEAARYGIDLNAGLAAGTISTAPKQVLAPNIDLQEAADAHSAWMRANGTFSHTGAGGSSPGDRMGAAGYTFSGSWSWGENISYRASTAPLDPLSTILSHHEGLFRSAGHRTNILGDGFREIGVGQDLGSYRTPTGTFYNYASLVTENFAKSGSGVFVTGVAYTDSDGDGFYSLGEGRSGVSFTAAGAAATSAAAGGYALKLASASAATAVTVTAGTRSGTVTVDTSAGNVKLDVVNGDTLLSSGHLTLGAGWDNAKLIGAGNLSLTGNASANSLTGNKGANLLTGGAGNDRIDGGAGNDTAIFNAASTGLTVTKDGDRYVLTTADGTDTVWNVESFRFSDKTLSAAQLDALVGTGGGGGGSGGGGGGGTTPPPTTLSGTTAADLLRGTELADVIRGLAGDDKIYGNGGDDYLRGDGGKDILFGGAGNDTLDGGAGRDRLRGEAGADTFIYSGGRDIFFDFDPVEDLLQIADGMLAAGRTLDDVLDSARDTTRGIILTFSDAHTLTLWGIHDAADLGDSIGLIA